MVVVAAVVFMSASGAATATVPSGTAIDVSTRSGIVEYLRSIHVDPRGVVIQRGALNYAGANCPGSGWTCTATTHPVVQVASAGGRNVFRCSAARCAVVQVGQEQATTNSAACVKTTGVSQTCKISQANVSGDNQAVVYQNAVGTKGTSSSTTTTLTITQSATSFASIIQKATGPANAANSNEACVYQAISLDRSGTVKKGVVLNQSAHQTVTINQNSKYGGNSADESATAAGHCTGSSIMQRQVLTSTLSGPKVVNQKQNAAKLGANMTINIAQNQGAAYYNTAKGANSANFNQYNSLTAVANTPAGPVRQTQSSAVGGLLGTINQDSRDPSTISTTQTEIQCEDAATSGLAACHTHDADAGEAPASLTQTQFGPVHKGVGVSTQTGDPADTFAVSQSSTQDNDQGAGSHQTNTVQGDCSTDGSCSVTQHATINGEQSTNMKSGQEVNTTTTCAGANCTSTGGSYAFNNIDVKEFGLGGMRGGDGTGTINVTGIKGTVLRAYLYWNGPTNSSDPKANAVVSFHNDQITGHNIGIAGPNCWGFTNTMSYRADVTHWVNGNGGYELSNFVKSGGSVADINGVALFVFYNDGDHSNDRNVVLWNGNDSNSAYGNDPQGWDEPIRGVPYPGSGSSTLDLVVADGQSADDAAIIVSGHAVSGGGPVFQGGNGSLWDVKSFTLGYLNQGSNDLHLTSALGDDCLSLVVAAANTPVHPSTD